MTMACKCNKLLKLELNFSLVLQSYDPKIYRFRHFLQNDYKLIFDNLLQKHTKNSWLEKFKPWNEQYI